MKKRNRTYCSETCRLSYQKRHNLWSWREIKKSAVRNGTDASENNMTKEQLLRQYDGLMLCAENGKYGETKETVRKWMEGALDALVDDVRAERDREMVGWIETPLNTHDGVREKTVDDFIEYLRQKGNFVCPLDCGIEVEHTHPYGDIKKVYIK